MKEIYETHDTRPWLLSILVLAGFIAVVAFFVWLAQVIGEFIYKLIF